MERAEETKQQPRKSERVSFSSFGGGARAEDQPTAQGKRKRISGKGVRDSHGKRLKSLNRTPRQFSLQRIMVSKRGEKGIKLESDHVLFKKYFLYHKKPKNGESSAYGSNLSRA